MKNIIFEHLKEGMILFADRNQTKAININFLTKLGNNLKSLALIFQVAIHFHPSHPEPKMLVNSFSALI